MKLIRTLGLLLTMCLLSTVASAQDEVAYYGFEPDITTNFLKEGNDYRLGFVRVAVEVMVPDPSYVSVVEHHAPLLRDAFINIFSTATERQVRTMTGRDQLRLKCLERAKELMDKSSQC